MALGTSSVQGFLNAELSKPITLLHALQSGNT